MTDKYIRELPGPAARLLKSIYQSDTSKQAGKAYSQKNREKLEEAKANGYVPKPVEPEPTKPVFERPKVSVPKVGTHKREDEEAGPSGSNSYRPSRRPYEEIQMEMDRLIEEQMYETRNYRPRGPLLDEKEKRRLATMNEWGGKPPAEVLEAALNGTTLPARPPREKKTEREELEGMFSKVMNEIEERKAFMEEMDRQGKGDKYRNITQREIQERIQELNKIDRLIKTAK